MFLVHFRYITNPLLLDKKKFDIRCYMLIANAVPYLVLFHQGYVRLTIHDYDNNSENLIAHLTNQVCHLACFPARSDGKNKGTSESELRNRLCLYLHLLKNASELTVVINKFKYTYICFLSMISCIQFNFWQHYYISDS